MITLEKVAPAAASRSAGQLSTDARSDGSVASRAATAAEPSRSVQTQYQGAPGAAVRFTAALRKVKTTTVAAAQPTAAGVTGLPPTRNAPITGASVCTRLRTMRS